jgi:hypothetical protein
MRKRGLVVLFAAVLAMLLLSLLVSRRKSGRSSSIKSADCCSAFQESDPLPDQPPPGVTRLAIGGDSRDDHLRVLPWAFQQAKKRGASAFLFLGDLEIDRSEDKLVKRELADLQGVPFYPLIGNHEVEFLGALRLPGGKHAVDEFKEDFLATQGLKLAPIAEVAYGADIGPTVHYVALDNVSRRKEGFGAQQLAWLGDDLKAARAANKVIVTGMHKGLANNPVTGHAMDEDGPAAVKDSDAALALFQQYGVAIVFVSHSHMYAAYTQGGIPVRLTGGLGAPLVKGLAKADGGFHHFLLLDVPAGDSKAPLHVEVVKFEGGAVKDDKEETEEVE